MNNKIVIHTDASNILNLNTCRIASIVEFNGITIKTFGYCLGKINQAEMIAVLKTLRRVEKDYQPVDCVIEVYTDHYANVDFLKSIISAKNQKSVEENDKVKSTLIRKELTWWDIEVIFRLVSNNDLCVNWIPRRENRNADRLTKRM